MCLGLTARFWALAMLPSITDPLPSAECHGPELVPGDSGSSFQRLWAGAAAMAPGQAGSSLPSSLQEGLAEVPAPQGTLWSCHATGPGGQSGAKLQIPWETTVP